MHIWRLFTCAALWVSAAGHAFVDEYGSATQPYSLGDATTDSWALCVKLDPGQVAYYTFSADARGGTPEDKMWLGTYSPGCSQSNPACPERDFDFSVTVWGNGTFVDCEPWAGWGDTVASTNYSVPAAIQVAGTVFGPGPATTFHAPARPFQRPNPTPPPPLLPVERALRRTLGRPARTALPCGPETTSSVQGTRAWAWVWPKNLCLSPGI